MKRDLMQQLENWKNHPLRMPLILRGARQVGKSWLVREFGKSFSNFVEINFDQERNAHGLFEGDLNIHKIVEKISLYKNQKIQAGTTLLFFDEIQECENALQSLRYFKENNPELHVIAAGSLIDFALDKLGVPVGRVQFLHLYPFSFGEFLTATGRSDLREQIAQREAIVSVHEIILDLLKEYLLIGGMPAVLDTWLNTRDYELCQELQGRIINSYRQDFNKYAKRYQIPFVNKVFDSIPSQLGKKFKYVNVDQDIQSAPLRQALLLLAKAGICYQCFHTSGQGLPFSIDRDERKFKVFFFDIGLTQRMLGVDLKNWVVQPLAPQYLGGIAEQFVAQEAVAYGNYSEPAELYYWHREARGSNAEVDFLFSINSQIIPAEVKSGTKGGLKSLQVFLASHTNSPYGLKISENVFAKQNKFFEVPLYGLEPLFKNFNIS